MRRLAAALGAAALAWTVFPAGALAEPQLAGPPMPAYPLGPGQVPDFDAPGDPFTLTDLRFDLSDTFRTQQSFGARVRYKNAGYLGASFAGERRGMELTVHRLSLRAFSEDGNWDLGADWRWRRLALSSSVLARRDGGGALLDQAVAFRLTQDLEAQGWVAADTSRPADRLLREAALGMRWQRGARLEASAQAVRSWETTEAGENRRDAAYGSVVAQLGPAELSGSGSAANVVGRFRRREGTGEGRLRVPLVPRLLFDASARGSFEAGAGSRAHVYGGTLSWLARPYVLPRAGEVGRRAVALARRASEAGEYELRVFDEDALRSQRERLSLSPGRETLRGDMEALYEAQVEERLVPLAGLSAERGEDALTGETWSNLGAFAGVPWPPAWPWRASRSSVPFLVLAVGQERRTTATSFRSDASSLSLTVSLSRELVLLSRFTRREPTALDLIRGIGTRNTFELSCVYARGR